ncbi:endonuclease/exonuclease/phosphatase family protein [Nonomuraea sp. NPDC046570]|uniref:endonuclease/exonuclease/phosphatase family protein n=1 Tax=Nonomuraea sp. NPDC046570 TaxID=3155255 RepID=UPI0033C2BF2A
MKGRTWLAAGAVLAATTTPAAQAPTPLSVMTWNVCAGTNPACPMYGRSVHELARSIGEQAVSQPIRPDVIFLQEFCAGATQPLEQWLELSTGRPWTARSADLTGPDGRPYACHPDRAGRPRGAQSVTVAVAGPAPAFTIHPLDSPPWYVKRSALCAAIPARRINACAAHLSSGLPNDDPQPGAPYRTRQVRQLLAAAARPGHRAVLGGDLNLTPARAAVRPAYRAYDECDTGRAARWTHQRAGDGVTRKLDYLFAPAGSVRGCHVDRWAAASDHRPVYLKAVL